MKRPVVTASRLIAQARAEGEIVLPSDALITPAAADWLRTTRVAVRTADAGESNPGGPRRYLIGNGSAATIQTLLPGLERRFPALEFLSCRGDRRCLLDSLRTVCDGLRECPERRAVVVVPDGSIASCVANKHAWVRAAVVQKPSALRMLQRELGANLLIVESDRFSLHQTRAMIEAFLSGKTAIDPLIAAAMPANDGREGAG